MLVAQATHQSVLLDEWGFGKLLACGRGVTALFAGPPGVGKTLAAEAIAFELGRSILTVS
jgi:SpoVK/Ycf46/Vps4 family AAA+-type ATPase